jgi:hypothetical protein
MLWAHLPFRLLSVPHLPREGLRAFLGPVTLSVIFPAFKAIVFAGFGAFSKGIWSLAAVLIFPHVGDQCANLRGK